MLNKIVCILMLMFISANSPLVVVISVHYLHHNSEGSMHAYFHDSGQPHEHDINNNQKFEISYSKQAFEHNNSLHDGGTAGINMVITIVMSSLRPDLVIDEHLR